MTDVIVPSRRASAAAPRFRYESEMIPLLQGALPALTFGTRTVGDVEVFTEVPAVHGVPDVTAVRFDRDAIARRVSAGVKPLTTDIEVRVALALTQVQSTPAEIAERSRYSTAYVRSNVLPMLVDAGWAVRDGSARYIRAAGAVWASKRVVTVEAKLRDWSRAIGQARRQQVSADAAYIAMEAPALRPIADSLDLLASDGVGVIAVDPATRRTRIVVRPQKQAVARTLVGRLLITERCLEMRARGEYAGQVYPVFGWLHPAQSGQ